jgi:phage tail sheath protein FI
MPTFLHPGVYVLEVPSGARSIEAVSTSTAIFVGPAERGPLTPTLITSRADYDRQFGGYTRGSLGSGDTSATLAYSMDGFFGNGGSAAYILRAVSNAQSAATASRNVTGIDGVSQFTLSATSPGAWPDPVSATIGSTTVNFGVYAVLTPSTDYTSLAQWGVPPTATWPPGNTGPQTNWPAPDPSLVAGLGGDVSKIRFRIVVVYTPPGTSATQVVEDWDHLSTDPNDEHYVVDVLTRSAYIRWAPDPTTGLFSAMLPQTWDLASNAAGTGAPTPNDLSNGQPATNDYVTVLSAAIGLTGGQGDDLSTPLGPGGTSPPFTTAAQVRDYQLSLLNDVTDAGLLVMPSLPQYVGDTGDRLTDNLINLGIQYVENRPRLDLFFIGALMRHNDQSSATTAAQAISDPTTGELRVASIIRSTYAALYWPWVQANDPVGIGKNPTIMLSPDAHVAGIYARIDAKRGVWKAPAGLEAGLANINFIEFALHDAQQDLLNPLGVNCLRNQPAGGDVVWGARTLRPDTEWRYVPVRRMAIFLRMSIYNGIQFAVFEDNAEPLWAALRLAVGGFMDRLFRQGAFAGARAADSFFVRCDSETTPPDDRAAGFVNILVGFAPSRPAEFVVVKLSQMVGSQ